MDVNKGHVGGRTEATDKRVDQWASQFWQIGVSLRGMAGLESQCSARCLRHAGLEGGASQGCVEGREEGKWADLRTPQRKRQIQEAITQLAGGGRAGQGWALRTLRSEGDYLRPSARPQASPACPPFWGWGVGERRGWKRREGKLGLLRAL